MTRKLLHVAFFVTAATAWLHGQTFDIHRETEKANKQTLPAAAKSIEENTDAKVVLEVDSKSFGNDARAWSNLNIITNRIVGALSEVGRDQMGKDAIDRDVKRVVIAKGAAGTEDMVEFRKQTVYVNTSASDKAMVVLQNVIVAALEKALQTGHPPTP